MYHIIQTFYNIILSLFFEATLTPCVLFIDEIDAISSNRVNAQKDMERRIVAQLLNSLDSLNEKPGGSQVLVIGATNRADSLDPALRRVGRFDQEISLGIPDRDARRHILQILCKKLKLEDPFDFDRLAALTPGYVGADLLALATRAASTAVKRIFKDKEQELFVKSHEKVGSNGTKVFMEVDELLDSITTNKTTKINGDDSIQIIDDNEPEVVSSEPVVIEEKKSTKEDEAKEDEVKEAEVKEAVVVSEIPENVESTKSVEKMETDEDNVVASTECATITQEKIETNTETAMEESQEGVVGSSESHEMSESASAPIVEVPDVEDNEVSPVCETTVEAIDEPTKDEEVHEPKAVESTTEIKSKELSLVDLLGWLNNSTPPLTQAQLNEFCITMQDFLDALKLVQPSAKREGFITVPDVTWDDIGSLSDIREQLKLAILAPVKYPARLKILGLSAPSGVLLCGPPGCGKVIKLLLGKILK